MAGRTVRRRNNLENTTNTLLTLNQIDVRQTTRGIYSGITGSTSDMTWKLMGYTSFDQLACHALELIEIDKEQVLAADTTLSEEEQTYNLLRLG
jgi:hypothetical protein